MSSHEAQEDPDEDDEHDEHLDDDAAIAAHDLVVPGEKIQQIKSRDKQTERRSLNRGVRRSASTKDQTHARNPN